MGLNNPKKIAAQKAIDYLISHSTYDSIIGIGTGTTTAFFIELLAESKIPYKSVFSSSFQSTQLLNDNKIVVTSLHELKNNCLIDFYVDGADEISSQNFLIKGGGGALTGEKVLASISKEFICIADKNKRVKKLGRFPLPIEYIEPFEKAVIRSLAKLNGNCVKRENFTTDYANPILDVTGINFDDPLLLESVLNSVPGIVTNGIFALQRPHKVFTD